MTKRNGLVRRSPRTPVAARLLEVGDLEVQNRQGKPVLISGLSAADHTSERTSTSELLILHSFLERLGLHFLARVKITGVTDHDPVGGVEA